LRLAAYHRLVPRPPFPDWVAPMAATLTQERFAGPEWTFERKLDGIRLLAFKDARGVRLFSRTRNEQHLPHVADAVGRLPARDAILDGEVEWDGSRYHVFDVPWLDGRDLRDEPIEERRRVLDRLPLRPPPPPGPGSARPARAGRVWSRSAWARRTSPAARRTG
jgi:ATP-dependent DNA ligase